MPSLRKMLAALLVVIGVAVCVLALWLRAQLDGDGSVTFSGRSDRALLIPAAQTARSGGTVTITASAPGGVWLGQGRPDDVADVVASADHAQVGRLAFPSKTIDLDVSGSGTLGDLRRSDIWTMTTSDPSTARLTITAADQPVSILAVPSAGTAGASDAAAAPNAPAAPQVPMQVTVRFSDVSWATRALAAAAVGVLLALAGVLLWRRRPTGSAGRHAPSRSSRRTVGDPQGGMRR